MYRFYHAGEDETLALRGVSFRVDLGEMVALLGPSGSGKSTLLACLAGLDEPDGGYVAVRGQRLTRRPEAERAARRAAQVGVLLQSGNLLEHLSVEDNVALPMRLAHAFNARRRDDMLARLGLEERRRARPSELSGGEAARAGLAVALACEPTVYLGAMVAAGGGNGRGRAGCAGERQTSRGLFLRLPCLLMPGYGEDAARRLEQVMTTLLQSVEALGERSLQRIPREGEWSAIQTLGHVAELVPFWAQRARAVAQGAFEGRPYDRTAEELELRSRAVLEHGEATLSEMLARLRASLQQGAEMLRSIPDEGWTRSALWGAQQVQHSVAQLVEERLIKHVEAHAHQARDAAGASPPPPGGG